MVRQRPQRLKFRVLLGALLGVLWLGLAWPLAAQAELPAPVRDALAQADIPPEQVAIVVQTLDGETLLQHGAARPFNPASVMKLLTTLAALDTWGPAHRFQTRVWQHGELRDGVLHGNLILQGGGDPGLTPERLWLMLRELRQRGVRELRGDVVLDLGLYAIPAIDPAAFDGAPLRPYNAPPAALLVNFNLHHLHLMADAAGVRAWLDPQPPDAEAGLRLHNRVRPSEAGCGDDWRAQISLRREGNALWLDGHYPLACGARSLALNLDSPAATTAAWFATLWHELGGRHVGQFTRGATPAAAQLLLGFDSAPLSELVRDINRYSNNAMSMMLYLNHGAHRLGAPATWDKAERALRDWLGERALELPHLVLENGSGLSRVERLTAAGAARLLAWAAQQPFYHAFAASLPATGQEGTLQRRFIEPGAGQPELRGRARLKTGSLSGVRNLAGYVLAPDAGAAAPPAGNWLILVFFVNHPHAARAGAAQTALLAWARNAPHEGADAAAHSAFQH